MLSKENVTRLAGYGSLAGGAAAVLEGARSQNEQLLLMGAGLEVIALAAFASLFLMSFRKPQTA